jgi:hypothetical protein
MGIKYGTGQYYGTRGSVVQTYFSATTKREARSMISLLPTELQANAKRFIGSASDTYDSFSISQDTAGRYIMVKEKPGNVPGSRAIYFKVVDANGDTIKVYKETYDHQGNLVHSKVKKEEQ